jgi:hypothetical protein
VLGVVTLAFGRVEKASDESRRALLALHAAPLTACLEFGVGFGAFTDADRPMAVLVGMLAVAAMATQNALGTLALKDAPPTAVMTTNITQLTIDLATLARGRGDPDKLAQARRRASMTCLCVVGFVCGCAAGAVPEVYLGLWALALPVILAALAVPQGGNSGVSAKPASNARTEEAMTTNQPAHRPRRIENPGERAGLLDHPRQDQPDPLRGPDLGGRGGVRATTTPWPLPVLAEPECTLWH